MGTPLMSLQGWIEVVRSRPNAAAATSPSTSRPTRSASSGWRSGSSGSAIPRGASAIGLGATRRSRGGYFRPRLPRHANPIELRVEAAGAGPMVLGDPILLEWALEALVKNAIDALQRPARHDHAARWSREPGRGVLRVIDDGPGVSRAPSGGRCSRPASPPRPAAGASGWRSPTGSSHEAHGGDLVLEPTRDRRLLLPVASRSRTRRPPRELPLPRFPESRPARGRRACRRPAAGAGRRRVGEDARAHRADRQPDRAPRRGARPDLRRDVHQQGRRRDEGADRRGCSGATRAACGSAPSTRSRPGCSAARQSTSASRAQFTIYDEDDRLRVIRRILEQLGHPPKVFPPKAVQSIISAAKNRMTAPSELLADGRRSIRWCGWRRRSTRRWGRRCSRPTRWTSTTCCSTR